MPAPLSSSFTGLWLLAFGLPLFPHIQAFHCIPGSKGKDKDPGNETHTVGAVQWVLGGGRRCQAPGAALDATLLCGLQWEKTQPDQDKHRVLCFTEEGAQWPSRVRVHDGSP